MASSIPANLKAITPYVLRGREVLKGTGDEVVAYHCFKYALELGMRQPKTPEGQTFLLGLMDELEALKPKLAGRSQEDLKITCETFAQQVFNRADAVDRAGGADKSTAQTFYAAASFLEMCKQFYREDEDDEESAELKEQILYAKFKAMDILKAVKEGRVPRPGPPVQEEGEEEEAPVPRRASVVVPAPAPPAPVAAAAAAAAPRPYVPPPVSRPPPQAMGNNGNNVSKADKADALELIRFARAAIEADDYPVGIARLQEALARLQ